MQKFSKEVVDEVFLSTPSARRATGDGRRDVRYLGISIHALREEGDLLQLGDVHLIAISIHALREEGDEAGYVTFTDRSVFLSTPSARRATL